MPQWPRGRLYAGQLITWYALGALLNIVSPYRSKLPFLTLRVSVPDNHVTFSFPCPPLSLSPCVAFTSISVWFFLISAPRPCSFLNLSLFPPHALSFLRFHLHFTFTTSISNRTFLLSPPSTLVYRYHYQLIHRPSTLPNAPSSSLIDPSPLSLTLLHSLIPSPTSSSLFPFSPLHFSHFFQCNIQHTISHALPLLNLLFLLPAWNLTTYITNKEQITSSTPTSAIENK